MSRERATAAAERLHGLDGLRALAILLVVAGHGLLSFMETPIGWAIQDRSRSIVVDVCVWVTRAFLMPVFFWTSGFFARATVERAGLAGFARQRIQRVLAPFLVILVPSSLALNTMWDWGRALRGGRAGAFESLPVLRASELPVTLGHLWYLYYLLVVSVGATAALLVGRLVFGRTARHPNEPSIWGRVRGPVLPLLLACPVTLLLAGAGKLQLDTPLSFTVDPTIASFYGLFFAWGWEIESRREELSTYARQAWIYLVVAFGLLVVIVPALRESVESPALGGGSLVALAASAGFTCFTTAAFLGLCQRYFDRDRPWVRLVSDGSYWCYLMHLPLTLAPANLGTTFGR
jgi:glucan biosynthesis protein C